MESTAKTTMIVQLNVQELELIMKNAITEALEKKKVEKPNINEYFDGIDDLAEYLRCSRPFAAKVIKSLPKEASLRVGKKIRIYKQPVHDFLAGQKSKY